MLVQFSHRLHVGWQFCSAVCVSVIPRSDECKSKGKTNQACNDILHVRIRSATALSTKIIKPRNPVHKEVDNGNNNGDSDGVAPYHDGSDDAGAAVRFEMSPVARVTIIARAGEPTKDTEERGQNIDAEDGSNSVRGKTRQKSQERKGFKGGCIRTAAKRAKFLLLE